jgi:hypothetical protein
MSALVRSGWEAAKSAAGGPKPSAATRSQPKESKSANMSSAVDSAKRSSTWGNGSEAPRPRGSNQIEQVNEASRS